jgi:hypothetical protein
MRTYRRAGLKGLAVAKFNFKKSLQLNLARLIVNFRGIYKGKFEFELIETVHFTSKLTNSR